MSRMSADQLIAVLWSLTTALAIVTGCFVVERLRPSEHDPGVVARLESLVLFLLNALLLTALSPFLTALVVQLPSLRLLRHIGALDCTAPNTGSISSGAFIARITTTSA
jgi:hypothetical protein